MSEKSFAEKTEQVGQALRLKHEIEKVRELWAESTRKSRERSLVLTKLEEA